MAYDIIGDIHGQADKLHALLAHMGYEDRGGAYRHPDRTAIFVGDFIDKGPQQLESVQTVRRMVEAGTAQAVMGNHEFNAIAWHTPDPDLPGEYLRQHGGSWGGGNRNQHAAFLNQVQGNPSLHQEVIDWFMTLPLWLDLPGIRVVHACWHDGYMSQLKPYLTPANQLTPELLVSASRTGREEYIAVEGLTKGLEVCLPNGQSFKDKYGHPRRNVRIQWWNAEAITYGDLAICTDELREQLCAIPISHDARSPYDNTKPVFFGHYWMRGEQKAQTHTAACVDYSAAEDGPLVAYRWDGEPELLNDNFQKVG
jgi:diadenosine tetraphosphatase ApaH/serine/threonine PP2A family protein phosphatase